MVINMNKRKISIALILISLLLMSISLIVIFGPKKDYLTTKGIIVDIVESYDATDDSNSYTPIINYSINGIEYKNVEYGAYISSMNIGDEVLVYYEVDNPTHIQAEGFEKVPYVVLGLSIISIIISIIMFIKK